MKTLISLLIFLASSSPAFAAAKSTTAGNEFGIGFAIGEPLAVSGRYNIDAHYAADAQLAAGDNFLIVYGDFLYQSHGFFGHKNRFIEQLTPYVGIGPLLALASRQFHSTGDYFHHDDDDFALAARIPIGTEWRWDKFPLGVGLELAPGFVLAPVMRMFLHADLTVRFYF